MLKVLETSEHRDIEIRQDVKGVGDFGIYAHGYSNHTPLHVLPQVHYTWAIKPTHLEDYVCIWTTSAAPIACY